MAKTTPINVSIAGDYNDKDIKRAMADLQKLNDAGKGFGAQFARVGKQFQDVGKQVSHVGGSLTKGLTLPILAGGAAMIAFAKGAEDAEIANRKLGSVLDSMGYPEATRRVSEYAESLERSLAVDADVIKATQTKLATFKNLTATVGEAGGAFDRATMAALDLAAAGFGSAEQNAVQLGKALQDPVKGITALGRAGVTFTEQEKEKIKALVESGDLLGAQNMVLQALESQVGGTAQAGASSFDRMKLSLMQVADALGMAVLPLINQLSDFVANTLVPTIVPKIDEVVAAFTNLDPGVKKAILAFIGLAASIGPVLLVVGKVITVFGSIIAVVNPLTLKIAAVVAVIALVVAAFKLAYNNSEVLRDAISQLIGTVQRIAQVMQQQVLGAFRAVTGQTSSFGDILRTVGRVLGVVFGGAINVVTGLLKVLGSAAQVSFKVFEVGVTVLRMVAEIIRAGILITLDILLNKLGPVSAAFRAMAMGIRSAFTLVASVVSGVFNNIGAKVAAFINLGIGAINALIDAYNKVASVLRISHRATRIAEFQFQSLTGSTTAAASSANNLANQVGGYASQVMRGNEVVEAAVLPAEQFAAALDTAGVSAGGAGGAAKKSGDDAKEAAKKYREAFKKIRGELTEAVTDIQTKMADMATSVSSSLMRGFQFGDTAEEFGENGERIGGTFIERLQAQADKVTGFAARIKELMALGLDVNSPLMQAVINEGATPSGLAIAQSLIDSGAEGINQATGMLTAAQGAADEIGLLAAGNFYQAGLDSAQQTLNAFVDRFGPEGKSRKRMMSLMDSLANAMRRETTVTVTTINRVMTQNVDGRRAMGGPVASGKAYLVGERGPEVMVMGQGQSGFVIPNHDLSVTGGSSRAGGVSGGSVINLTVNAGMGTQGAEVGRQIVDALKAYERRNGSVYVSA